MFVAAAQFTSLVAFVRVALSAESFVFFFRKMLPAQMNYYIMRLTLISSVKQINIRHFHLIFIAKGRQA